MHHLLLYFHQGPRGVWWKKGLCFSSVRVWFLIAVLYGKEAGCENIKTLLRPHEMVTEEGSIKPRKALQFYRGYIVGFTRGDLRRWYSGLTLPRQAPLPGTSPTGFPLRVLQLWNVLVTHTHSWCSLLSVQQLVPTPKPGVSNATQS